MRIITVSREFGSGGREVGKRLADALGFTYYDREIVTAVAAMKSLDENYVEKTLEAGPWANFPLTFGVTLGHLPPQFHDSAALLAEQKKIICQIAEGGDCVIVGRNADVLLSEYHPLKLFIHADLSARIARCRGRAKADEQGLSDKEFSKKIRRIDRARAKYHALLSPVPWGDPRGYQLCIDTTDISPKELIEPLAAYVQRYFEINSR